MILVQFDLPFPCAVSLAPCAFAQMNPIFIQSLVRLNPEIYDTRYYRLPYAGARIIF